MLKTVAKFDQTSVDITGGSIDGTTIGATTASSGAFTTLTSSSDATVNSVRVGRGEGNVGSNTAVGLQALNANTTGNNNTACGVRTLFLNTTGGANVAIGVDALRENTSGFGGVAIGFDALRANTTANSNIAIGFQTLRTTTTGGNNTAVGYQALEDNAAASFNTAFGMRALRLNDTGATNSAVGYLAGDVITGGSRNTILGANSDPSGSSGSDQVVVGEGLTGKGDDTAFVGGTNGAYNEKNVTTWETTSDVRIKKNIVDVADGLNVISKIRVRNFEYRTSDEIVDLPSSAAIPRAGMQIGVIAQEIQQVLPECVTENTTGVLSVNTDSLVWYLINAVKELSVKIKKLESTK